MKATINDEIVAVARQWLGEKEIEGNQGFIDNDFQAKMMACGWEKGQAWCAYLAELVWKTAFQQWDATLFQRLDKLFTGSAVQTFRNFQKTKDFIISDKPVKGSLMVWQTYKDGKPFWTGHVGIVEVVNYTKKEVVTIEGNSNSHGGREGIEVANLTRKIDYTIVQNGKVLLGFVHPKNV